MNRLEPGYRLGERYTMTRHIATGGMAEVWEATDETLERQVAIKIMRPATEDEIVFAKRFHDEARHTAGLSHLNIATLFDYGDHDGLAFIVMELVRGEPLSAWLRQGGPMEPAMARSVIGQAALALGVAHEAGVVHRDVKPANILLTSEGLVKLTDFGIARAIDGTVRTRTGEILGTPYYLSPEQALGEPATGASDIYSLGVVAHELLTGRRPFDRGTPVATALAQVNDSPPPLPDDIPADLIAVVEACLAKDAADRPATAQEIAIHLGLPGLETPAADSEPAVDVDGDDARTPTPLPRLIDPRPLSTATAGRDETPSWALRALGGRPRSAQERPPRPLGVGPGRRHRLEPRHRRRPRPRRRTVAVGDDDARPATASRPT